MSKKKEKKPQNKGKRKKTTYPNLNPGVNLRSRWEEIYDVASYAKKLDPKDRAWLDKFMGEYVNAALDYENLENNLHNTSELKKSCTDRNNARNRDIYKRAEASGNLVSIEDLRIAGIKIEEQLIAEESNNLEDNPDKSSESGDSSEDF